MSCFEATNGCQSASLLTASCARLFFFITWPLIPQREFRFRRMRNAIITGPPAWLCRAARLVTVAAVCLSSSLSMVCKAHSTLATMSKQHCRSNRPLRCLLLRQCCRFGQQCRSNVRTFDFLEKTKFQRKTLSTLLPLLATKSNVASTLLLMWTGLNAAGGTAGRLAAGRVGGRAANTPRRTSTVTSR